VAGAFLVSLRAFGALLAALGQPGPGRWGVRLAAQALLGGALLLHAWAQVAIRRGLPWWRVAFLAAQLAGLAAAVATAASLSWWSG
jgi:hypothetical protein